MCVVKTCVSFAVFLVTPGGFIKTKSILRNHSTSDTFSPSKSKSLDLAVLSDYNFNQSPSRDSSSLHPAALPPSPLENSPMRLASLGSKLSDCLQCLGCLVCTVANPRLLFSDPLPALSVNPSRGQEVEITNSSFVH